VSPFAGFWMGGFEGADHVNADGFALDLVAQSGHLAWLDEDHRRAARAGLRVVRESIGWRLSEAPGGSIDLTRALQVQASARRHGLQVAWTLMHYGLPADLSLHDDAMIARLARFAAEVARALGPAVYTPVNEIGFLAWCASQQGLLAAPNGGPAGAVEDSRISGWAVKRRLAAASIAAVHAMRDVQPASRFMHVEPLVHVVAPADRPALADDAATVAGWQWQAWDLIVGRADRALGGEASLMDIVGVNHYHSSQWELETERRLDWAGRDARRRPVGDLLRDAWQRYGRPLAVAETSHVGAGRAAWLHDICRELRRVRRAGVPVSGLCLYPLTDRPDWQRPAFWHRSGVWHVEAAGDLRRHAEPEVLAALQDWQCELDGAPRRRVLVMFSHLRWDFVRHRARHLAEGLARRGWRIVFVEEALAGSPRLDSIAAGPHIDVLVPAAGVEGDGGERLAGWLAGEGILQPPVWLSTPMAWPRAVSLAPSQVVYDCADELSAFLGAPAALPQLEQAVLQAADLVCASAPGLAGPRAAPGRPVWLLPNGVDLDRFTPQAREPGGWDDFEAESLRPRSPGPQLGYAGVVDERLDLALIEALADARPHWQWVFVGPVLKIDEAGLPRRGNLHWLGAQPYRLLPSLMTGWRVALLPFLRSAATRHAQPLKVLEALAAGLPVVATPLDELRPWRAAGVHCAASPEAFLRACDEALAETDAQASQRRGAARRGLAGRDWAAAAAALDGKLRERGLAAR
jgi:UDP-galactopyranose mutase